MKKKCFIIQPFDGGIFDTRFQDTFKPAIESAAFEPYRVDQDLTVSSPISDIENGIKQSDICFAEITTNNPNVWYELGYAYACNKEVIMVCSNERTGGYPFDIHHKYVIHYNTNAKSHYEKLSKDITERIIARSKQLIISEALNANPVRDTNGLKSHEISLLSFILGHQMCKEEATSVYFLKNEMERAGYAPIATSIGIRSLEKLKMLETFIENYGFNNEESCSMCKITEGGVNWILSNQDKLQLSKFDDCPF